MSALRVYVAGSSAELLRAEGCMAKLREAGIEVTSTWPEVIRKVGEANPMGAPREARAAWARTDLVEVSASNFLWFLLPPTPSFGAGVEFGYAVMLSQSFDMAEALGLEEPPVYELLCSGTETSIFTALAHNHFDTDDKALGFLIGLNTFLEANPGLDDSVDHAYPEHPYPEGDDDFGPFDDEEGEGEAEAVDPDAVVTVLEHQVNAIFKKPSR